MARQNAKDLVIKIELPKASATFVTLGMLTTTDFSVDRSETDGTNKDSGDFTESDPGKKTLSASGTAFFDAGTAWERLRDAMENDVGQALMQVVDPGVGTYEGVMNIQTLGKTGGHEGKVEVNMSIKSAGSYTFT